MAFEEVTDIRRYETDAASIKPPTDNTVASVIKTEFSSQILVEMNTFGFQNIKKTELF